MSKVKFLKGADVDVGEVEVVDGQILYSPDKNSLYIDADNGGTVSRHKIVDVVNTEINSVIKIEQATGKLFHNNYLGDAIEYRVFGPAVPSSTSEQKIEPFTGNTNRYFTDTTVVDPATISDVVTIRVPYFLASQQGHIITNNEDGLDHGNNVALKVYPKPANEITSFSAPLSFSNGALSIGGYSETSSGIVTTGTQTAKGFKNFQNTVTLVADDSVNTNRANLQLKDNFYHSFTQEEITNGTKQVFSSNIYWTDKDGGDDWRNTVLEG